MPRVKPENRKRAKRPKTRSGCRTCKIRRVKCDETKPSCHRCTSTGRTCDGYEAVPGEFPMILWPSSIFSSLKEHRSFFFYLEKTARQVSGFDENDFWNRVILQAAHEDAATRAAVVALGSFHEDYVRTGEAERTQDDFALQQYNLAIRQHLAHLKAYSEDPDQVDRYLASCMIFICIELIQCHYVSALSLIRGAVKLFYEQCRRTKSAWPIETFELLLSRLQAQAVGLLSPSAVPNTIPPQYKRIGEFEMPKRFTTVSEAKQHLEFYSHSQILSSDALEEPYYGRALTPSQCLELLDRWTLAFDAMVAYHGENMTDHDRRAANVLLIWKLMLAVGVDVRAHHLGKLEDPMVYDLYEITFREVLELVEKVLVEAGDDGGGHAVASHRFTLDFGIVGPLYDITRICRDPFVRRRAIHLLRAYPRREGLWDGLLAAASGERQMELEETAVSEVRNSADVPAWARIMSALPSFQFGERWAIVEYIRQQPEDGSEAERFLERLEW
ncbi:uncharacterized protein LTR77_008726 [Saxophila tyrrhenica]|uniref:Zn(2)-C6 fungal-type domain-containing protein n=1 Tax=Saxophila tyrrhenica TaxID=1690608 RepID=A0AAV9NZZ9_9PEZI|nr:hypothetical protein LTR77_008726 [Saxophila tyrrhenica]